MLNTAVRLRTDVSYRKGPVETQYLNGEIVRMAKELDLCAPVNNKALEVIEEVSKTGRFISPDEAGKRFEGLI